MKRGGIIVILVVVLFAGWGLLKQNRIRSELKEPRSGEEPGTPKVIKEVAVGKPPLAAVSGAEGIRPRFGNGHFPTSEDRELLAFQRSTERLFGGVVDGLAISQSSKLHLKQLLAERFEAAAEAKRLMSQRHKREDASQVVIDATSQVDKEMASLVGDDLGREMTYMASSLTFGSLQANFMLDTQFGGAPLTGSQLLSLSHVFDQDAPTTGTVSPIDSPDGLSATDRKIYEDASKFLSLDQLVLLHDYLIVRHK